MSTEPLLLVNVPPLTLALFDAGPGRLTVRPLRDAVVVVETTGPTPLSVLIGPWYRLASDAEREQVWPGLLGAAFGAASVMPWGGRRTNHHQRDDAA